MLLNKTSLVNKTVFTSALNSNNSPFLSVGQTSSLSTELYHQLSLAIETLNNLLLNFALGNFEYVAANLTMKTYNTLSILMNSLQQNANLYPDYENIRSSINYSLEGLLQSVTQYITLNNTQVQLVDSQKKASILTDMVKLQEYLNSLKGARTLFPSTSVTTLAAKIKPEYAMYIKLYGYPANGVFDIDKLAIIINNK